MLSRRKLLQHVANGSSLMLMPRLVLASAEATKYELVAELTKHRFKPESKGLSSLWLYNGSSPGPMLENRLNSPKGFDDGHAGRVTWFHDAIAAMRNNRLVLREIR